MSFKSAVAFAAVVAVSLPVVAPAFAATTGSRLDRDEIAERRARKAEEEKAIWHYAVGSNQVGPLTETELVAAAEAGTIKADTQVYDPAGGWRLASQVHELDGALK